MLLIVLFAAPLPAAAEALRYERVYAIFDARANTLRITLDNSGLVTIERPALMTHAGVHVRQLKGDDYHRLRQAYDDARVDTRSLREDVRQRAEAERFEVSDPEYSRFYSLDDNRQMIDSVEVESLEPFARQFADDVRLQALDALEKEWWRLMQDALAREGTP